MPILLLSFKKVPGTSGLLIHGFLAPNDSTAAKMEKAHSDVCPSFGPVFRAGETIEQTIEVEEIPTFDEVAISDWVEDMFSLESDDEEEDASDVEDKDGEEDEPETT